MRVGLSRVHHPVTVLGYGTRVGVWFQGCSIHCPGCISQDTWAPAEPSGMVEVAEVIASIAEVIPVAGLTISGGEPFDQPDALAALVTGFRSITDPADSDVLVYSGYTEAQLRRRYPQVLGLLDAVVTGRFIQGRPGDGVRGSSNQRVCAYTDLARARYASGATPRTGLQAASAGGSLWMIGVPAQGDMERMAQRLAERGVQLRDMSWRC